MASPFRCHAIQRKEEIFGGFGVWSPFLLCLHCGSHQSSQRDKKWSKLLKRDQTLWAQTDSRNDGGGYNFLKKDRVGRHTDGPKQRGIDRRRRERRRD